MACYLQTVLLMCIFMNVVYLVYCKTNLDHDVKLLVFSVFTCFQSPGNHFLCNSFIECKLEIMFFVCLFKVYRPTREFFTHMKTSPLPVKISKF